jgi:hypothetical protein
MKIFDMMPHRLVDSVADGIVNGINSFGNTAVSTVKGVGKTVMGGLDKPFGMISGGREGPHRIADRFADSAADAVTNFVSTGVAGSVKKIGEGAMRALDQPLEQIKK